MQTNSTTVRWEGPGGLTVNSTDISVLATTRISLLMTEDFSLQIESLDLTDSGSYRCIVHGWWSNATSDVVNNATLDITTPFPNTTASPASPTDFLIEESSHVQLDVRDPKPPGAVYKVDVGPEKITVSWNKSDGPVISYTIVYSSQDLTNFTNGSITTNSSIVAVQNLQPFTYYVFQVIATFKQSYTKSSPQSIIQTGSGTPLSPPTNLSAFVDGSREINLTWEAPPPDSLQGNFVHYVVRFQEKSLTMPKYRSTVQPNYMLTDLKPFTTYQLSVAVQNDAMEGINLGPYSEDLEATTEEDLPSEPLRLREFGFMDTQFVILWEEPRHKNGQLIGYFVYMKEEAEDTWNKRESTQTVFAFLYLKPFTKYKVQVSARTKIGEGPNSTAIVVMTDVAPASPPRNVSVGSITNVSALITWTEPAVFYNSIDAYIIKYWEHGQLNNLTKESVEIGRSKILTNLTPGRSYFVTVSASTLNIQEEPKPVVGKESDVVSFRVAKNDDGMLGPGGTMSPSTQGRGWKIVLILFLIAITVSLLAFLYFGFVARKRQNMHFKQNGSRPVFSFSKPEELEEPPIPVDRFEEHVKANHADSDGGFATEYEDIQAVGNNFAALAGQEEGNKLKNRYTNIVAYDHTRVYLQTLPGHPDSHYINANYIDSYNQQGAYIATQGPLQNTIEDFWRMVWEQRCQVIVMITKLEERGRRKCERYWPSKGMSERFRDIEVSMDGKEKFCTYVLRTFNLRYKPRRHGKAQEMTVKHYHYIDWPDHGVPSHTLPVLDFVLRSSEANPEGAGPIIVHCSAGVGRTGTYIVIDSMLKQIKDCGKVNVFGFLKRIRTQRNYLVQTEEQYVFIHDVLLEWVKAGDTRIQAFNLKEYTEKMDLPDENGLVPLDVQHDQIMTQRIHAYQFMRARNPMNKPKNRNSQILPVERGRVTITGRPGVENSDYINASFLPGYWYKDAFIVTQYPLESTVVEYWKMLWENNCTIIVMLTGKEEEEESTYWPSKKDEPVTFEALKVTLLEEELSNMEFVTRDFLVESLQDEDPLQIRQYSCSYWPESCSPVHTTFDLINAVQKHCKQNSENSKYMNGPIVVHDKCGGRQAGTFCALTTLLDEMKEEKCVNIYKTVKIYSATRVGMFKKKEDYQFLYRALTSAYTIEKQLQSIERQKMSRSRARKIHRDWSFMVRQPVTSMDFRASHSPRRNSLDEDEFRARSQTLGSTGRVARPTKFWHRRAKSEKRKPIILNGDAAVVTDVLPCENGQAGGEVYDLESVQSYETDKMVDGDYLSDGDVINGTPEKGKTSPDQGKTTPDSSRTPTVTITAPNLPNDLSRERRLSSCSTDKLVDYNQFEDKVQFKDEETFEMDGDKVPMETRLNGLETDLNGLDDANGVEEDECVV